MGKRDIEESIIAINNTDIILGLNISQSCKGDSKFIPAKAKRFSDEQHEAMNALDKMLYGGMEVKDLSIFIGTTKRY